MRIVSIGFYYHRAKDMDMDHKVFKIVRRTMIISTVFMVLIALNCLALVVKNCKVKLVSGNHKQALENNGEQLEDLGNKSKKSCLLQVVAIFTLFFVFYTGIV
eukprot:CAMPEP_0170479518 /NCGR_PEP_ID=MMETSP0208-20121228/724_1 /TAXON_ID=197538 /ORGANISM="Strombidium inclinatum, Strain S3" /LENGTH=102 /DNA_ID=CAMNT_0010751925 /DNA_START=65 /DNA_END=373 /DNA_ORIENTATION=-